MLETQQAAIEEKLLSPQQRETAQYLEAKADVISRRTGIDSAMEAIRAARAERERLRPAVEPTVESRTQRLKRLGGRSPRRGGSSSSARPESNAHGA